MKNKNSNKIHLDKYYTSSELAKYVVEKTKEVIGEENITEYLESSAGAGVFLDYLDKPYLAYDIEPEDDKGSIIKQDFLELDLKYKKGRCTIGNPPFGSRMILAQKFYKKSVELGDYIVFILPISQLNNTNSLYEFDLIHSEDLGKQTYTDRKLHCCLNIYRRNPKGLNKKPNYKLKDIEIVEYRRNVKKDKSVYEDADFSMCAYGSGIIGKNPKYLGEYVKEMYFFIHNKKLKSEIISIIKTTNWEEDVCYGISGQVSLPQWLIYKYLKEQIPELE